ncbi:MAG TPA: sigma-70 family RNA polymerase sigma factor, partial [Pyrinomonadaceae bacterium]|nr:sigma-70 family RNA polymerase sigma factor [Pyrinomonadaceae bacterium]
RLLLIGRRKDLSENNKLAKFEDAIMPHFDAAYNLARWLTRSDIEAEDIVQESYLRAFKFYGGFRGENSRAWILRIVRNTFYSSVKNYRPTECIDDVGEEVRGKDSADPEVILMESINEHQLKTMLEELPDEFREAIVLREIEGLSYREIAEIADVPLGTVMSRIARARQRLQSGAISVLNGGAL